MPQKTHMFSLYSDIEEKHYYKSMKSLDTWDKENFIIFDRVSLVRVLMWFKSR